MSGITPQIRAVLAESGGKPLLNFYHNFFLMFPLAASSPPAMVWRLVEVGDSYANENDKPAI